MLKFLLYRLGQIIIHCVPRGTAYRFAQWISDLHYKYSAADREAVMTNLQQILGTDGDVSEQAREVFRNFGRYLVDFFFMYRVNKQFIENNVTFEGKENLERAVARGKGIIILTAHIGNWEMGAAVLSEMGYKMTVIALPHKERSVNDLFNRQRMKHGVSIVPISVAIRRCIEALRKGQMVALLGDRDFGSFGTPMMFLGRETHIPKGAAVFAHKTGATILPAVVIPTGNGTFRTCFEAPIIPPDGRVDDKVAVRELIQQGTVAIEKLVRRMPTQWLMFRKFGVAYEHLYPDTGA
ncbi:MAG: lysophospholipid acyltransferase family protein [Candidatus Omnitrophica bacterium]|nr:lysophospholipid acyltransferase family protein [Candidatus Omnitrophota bacterium]